MTMIQQRFWICTFLFMLCAVSTAQAQFSGQQFNFVGTLEKFTLNSVVADPGPPLLRGGLMRVSGHDVILPRNLLIGFPTRFLSPAQAFAMAPAGSTGSGLALDDNAPVPFEVSISGNMVGNAYIAGLVSIAQLSLGEGSGYIKAINPATGMLTIGATPTAPVTAADAIVQLNDPVGRFGPKAIGLDERFQLDSDNPSVTAETGYPMCIPAAGSPAYCAAVNRTLPGRLFVMGNIPLSASPAGGLPVPTCPTCDPTKMVPLRVGDAVIYSGILHKLPSGARIIAAYALTANVGIYTQPGLNPAYMRIEGSLAGTAGPFTPRVPPVAGSGTLPDEAQDRFKVEGFTTDPSRSIFVYALDVNPTDGTQRVRRLYGMDPKEPPRGRFFKVVGKNSGVLMARDGTLRGNTREIMVRLSGNIIADGTDLATVADSVVMKRDAADKGVFANRYVAPVEEYIFPENKLPGDALVPNNFECLAFLVNGSGPLGGGGPGDIVGPLTPWPGGAVPGPVLNCGTRPAILP